MERKRLMNWSKDNISELIYGGHNGHDSAEQCRRKVPQMSNKLLNALILRSILIK